MPGNKTPGSGAVAGKPPAVVREDSWKKAKKLSWKELKKLKKLKKSMKSREFARHPGSSSSTNPETDPGSSSKNPLPAAVRFLLQAPEGELEPTPAMTPGPQ
tara:strand:- start:825 stop:1130 length:306 start_codon:yes stop_codon:yes gene_type:complete